MNSINFYLNNSSKDSYDSYCKSCAKTKSRKWEIDNPEKYKALNKSKMPSKNPVRLERCREFNKKDQAKEYMSEWRNNNKDKLKIYGEQQQNKKHDITDKQWIYCKHYFQNCCAYCGLLLIIIIESTLGNNKK
ncbi:hypothetical protein [Paenibacillus ferrarius]|uniref:hypothetical protein n=1 Tax=Paenibacillus ferrarius TaxID=1469647 RepID=UPI0009A52D29|nr:hypothetical protein [Paenibacillus ferrarius]